MGNPEPTQPMNQVEVPIDREQMGQNFEALIASALERKVVNPQDYVAECVEQQRLPAEKAEELKAALIARIKNNLDLPVTLDQARKGRTLYLDLDDTVYLTAQFKADLYAVLLSELGQLSSINNFEAIFKPIYDQVYQIYGSVGFEPGQFIVALSSALGINLTSQKKDSLQNTLIEFASNKKYINPSAISALRSLQPLFNDANSFECLSNGRVNWQKAKAFALTRAMGLKRPSLNVTVVTDKTLHALVVHLHDTSAILDDRLINLIGIALNQDARDKFVLIWFNPDKKPMAPEEAVRLAKCQTIIIEIRSFPELITYLQAGN